MTIYSVTAANRFFYQVLAVDAANAEQAESLFRAYLDANRHAEEFEFGMAQQVAEELGEPSRADYVYDFDERRIEEADYKDIGAEVDMIGSGGNG